jgi:hypothetical protein
VTEQLFWTIIEAAWADSPTLHKDREKALRTNDEELLAALSEEIESTLVEKYRKRLLLLGKEDLTSFIHILEERLYNIDREEIHKYVDGSDDGFLYGRCFVVSMGEEYYNMVDKDPSKATMEAEAEFFGFTAYGVYEEKFDEEFERNTHHCIESGSNTEHWHNL